MGAYQVFSMTPEDVAVNFDYAMTHVIKQLVMDKIITNEQGVEFLKTHTFVYRRKSLFNNFLEKILKKGNDNPYVCFLTKIDSKEIEDWEELGKKKLSKEKSNGNDAEKKPNET